ncbi:hypothetical protein Tco_1015061 [Tanacetum coccineum]|uniref:Uncharacterized protein n=1 Tax=Tanacetum coccineum TaxID=301880 RepID=A0ABQ5FJT4_9ASTR
MIKAVDRKLRDRRLMKNLESQNQRDLPRDIPLDSVEVLSNDLRVLRIILVILPEHQSDTKVIHNDDGNPSRANIKQALGSEIVTHWFTLTVLSALTRSGNENMLKQYKHVGPKVTRSQEDKRLQDDVKRLCLVDDLKRKKITFISSQRYKPKPKVNDHYNISQVHD